MSDAATQDVCCVFSLGSLEQLVWIHLMRHVGGLDLHIKPVIKNKNKGPDNPTCQFLPTNPKQVWKWDGEDRFCEISVCVCVCNIWIDVKLLSLFLPLSSPFLILNSMQGDGEDIWGSIQRCSSYDPRISPGTPGDVPAVRIFWNSMGPS